MMNPSESKSVLLHCCCAPCSSAIIEWMLAHDVRPTLYYCNPNIYPEQEYLIRKNECTRYAQSLGLEIIDDDYDHAAWLASVEGLEHTPERGPRCLVCFKYRLLRAARKAVELGFSEFTTTLASSRWKSLDQINEAGRWAADRVVAETSAEIRFDDRNWRKGGLQQRRNELLREHNFYNQLYCGCEFSLNAVRRRYLPEVPSTNSYLLDTLSRGVSFPDETVVYTFRQTAGRGQIGNVWESEADCNIALSMLLCPDFLPARDQFVISELCCLGILDALRRLVSIQGIGPELTSAISVKWPNDIYAGDLKLGGILIENRLMGNKLLHAVLGVGININQERWVGNAPNPVSLRMLGFDTTPQQVLDLVVEGISSYYNQLKQSVGTRGLAAGIAMIHQQYMQCLYRKSGLHPYFDPQRNEHFMAQISNVDPQGPISLLLETGEVRQYWFKEVRFVLPCGVTKE